MDLAIGKDILGHQLGKAEEKAVGAKCTQKEILETKAHFKD